MARSGVTSSFKIGEDLKHSVWIHFVPCYTSLHITVPEKKNFRTTSSIPDIKLVFRIFLMCSEAPDEVDILI